MRLYLFPIGRNGHMPDLPKVMKFFKSRYHRLWIFSTKADGIHCIRPKRIPCHPVRIERVPDHNKARFNPIHGPGTVKSRDIRTLACIDYHKIPIFFKNKIPFRCLPRFRWDGSVACILTPLLPSVKMTETVFCLSRLNDFTVVIHPPLRSRLRWESVVHIVLKMDSGE